MEPEEITQIVTPDRFWWNILMDKSLFSEKQVIYDYRPYSTQFIDPVYEGMISVRRFIYLDITLGNSQLLDAGLVIDFHVHTSSFDNLKDELMRIGQDAHDRFVVIFKEKNAVPYISPTFRPTLDPEALDQKIQSLLQDGDGY
jgi:hypothetical protein